MKTYDIINLIEAEPDSIFYTETHRGRTHMFRIVSTPSFLRTRANREGIEVMPVTFNTKDDGSITVKNNPDRCYTLRNFQITGVFACDDEMAIEVQTKINERQKEAQRAAKEERDRRDASERALADFEKTVIETLDINYYRIGHNHTHYTVTLTLAEMQSLVARLNGTAV